MKIPTANRRSPSATVKLSLCIATFNRATFLRATLDELIAQATEDCEIVVCDNASTDDTERVVLEHSRHFHRLRYFKQRMNVGLDRNFDMAVQLAQGEYCWLMSDDDLLKPGAIATILRALQQYSGLSLVVVNTEYLNLGMSKIIEPRALAFDSDRTYSPAQIDRLFIEASNLLLFIGSLVINRAIWAGRQKEQYFGSLWIHVGVIFQERLPSDTLVISEPFIKYRCGNSHASEFNRSFEICTVNWPRVVQSLAISDGVKQRLYSTSWWANLMRLLWHRAAGWYSAAEYRRVICPSSPALRDRLLPALIAMLPGSIVNTLFVMYYSLASPRLKGINLHFMRESRFYLPTRRFLTFGRHPRNAFGETPR